MVNETTRRIGNRDRRSGFTLVELLTAVLIIAILAGFLLPAINAIREAANRKKAHADAIALEHAIQAYRSTYGVWPTQIAGSVDKVTADPTIIAQILDVLENNPRGEIFIQFPEGALSNGCLLDPWTRPYVIAMDENNDGRLNINISSGSGTLQTNLTGSIAVFSWGRFPNEENRRVYSWVQ